MVDLAAKTLAWAKSPAGQQRIDTVKRHAIASGKGFGNLSPADAQAMGRELANMIQQSAPQSIMPSAIMDVNVSYDGDSAFIVELSFNDNLIWRPSLGRNGNVYDIIGLISQGWDIDASRMPRGMWHGNMITAARHHDAQPFVEAAVAEWAAKYSGKYDVSYQINNPNYL